jgi:hypothetical protein
MARAEAELSDAAGDDEEAAPLVSAGAASAGSGAPRDVHLLSGAFLFVFLAYHAAQNLQSSVNTVRYRSVLCLSTPRAVMQLLPSRLQDENLGSLSLALLYTSFTAFAAVGSAVVRRMGSRRALVVGTSGYLLFIAANLAPSWYAPRLNHLCLSPFSTAAGLTGISLGGSLRRIVGAIESSHPVRSRVWESLSDRKNSSGMLLGNRGVFDVVACTATSLAVLLVLPTVNSLPQQEFHF